MSWYEAGEARAWPGWPRHTGALWARRHMSTRRSGPPRRVPVDLPRVRRDPGRPGPERAEPGRDEAGPGEDCQGPAAAVAAWLAEVD
jgi:hypothetical protein